MIWRSRPSDVVDHSPIWATRCQLCHRMIEGVMASVREIEQPPRSDIAPAGGIEREGRRPESPFHVAREFWSMSSYQRTPREYRIIGHPTTGGNVRPRIRQGLLSASRG